MIKRLLVNPCLVALFYFSCCALSAFEIEGHYSASGFDPYFKNSYTGTALIIEDDNDVYQFRWDYDQGGKLYESMGTGIRVGDFISIVFRDLPSENASEEGVQIYKITDDSLEGPFVLADKNLIGTEKLTKK